jgi:hypothetical protein
VAEGSWASSSLRNETVEAGYSSRCVGCSEGIFFQPHMVTSGGEPNHEAEKKLGSKDGEREANRTMSRGERRSVWRKLIDR